MSARIAWQGAPKLHATWHDEGWNGILKKVARLAHRRVWHARVLTEMSVLLKPDDGTLALSRSARKRRGGNEDL